VGARVHRAVAESMGTIGHDPEAGGAWGRPSVSARLVHLMHH
jgi:hypothetical protein